MLDVLSSTVVSSAWIQNKKNSHIGSLSVKRLEKLFIGPIMFEAYGKMSFNIGAPLYSILTKTYTSIISVLVISKCDIASVWFLCRSFFPLEKVWTFWGLKNVCLIAVLLLFQDSLGGNSKTTIIANISPSSWSVIVSPLCKEFFP